ncbi:MAG: hypothetical protein ACXW30_05165 [Micavibrio sp.]
MKNRNALVSKMAAAALAFSLAQGSAVWAQEAPQTDSTNSASATTSQTALVSNWSVAVDPLIPLGMIAGLGSLYAAFCLLAASRRMRGSWLRATAGGVLVLTMVNPEILHEDREKLQTEVVVVVDKSASQTIGGRDVTTQAAYDQVIRQLSQIKGVNIRTVEIDSAKDGVPVDGSNLFNGLEASLSDVPRERLGAVIMLTDGQVHDIPADLNMLGGNTPLHVLLSGKEGETDRRVVIEQAPRYGLVDKGQTIKFRVVDDGAIPSPDGKVNVVISSEGRVLETRRVTPGQAVEVDLDLPRTGPNIVEVSAEKLDGELTTVNNRAAVTIEGIRESMNVLLVTGTPDASTRMWRDLIKSDPDSNLVHFTIMRPPEKQDNTPLKDLSLIPVPTHELFSEKLDKFDLVIFDHYAYDGLLPAAYLNNVARYVQEGGALLVVSGPDYAGNGSLYQTPLASVLPAAPTGTVTESPYTPQLTTPGQRHPVTRNLNESGAPQWGRWTRLIDVTQPKGSVLMQGAQSKPLLILNRQDQGRVAMLMSDSAWLWARGYEGGGPHAALLQNISHWLTKSPALEEESLTITNKDGQLIVEQQTMADQSTPVTVRTPSGNTITVTPQEFSPGKWRATLPATELGLYSAEQGGRHAGSAFTNVGPGSPKEFINTLSTPDLLKPLVDAGQGGITRFVDPSGKVVIPRIEGRTTAQAGEGLRGADWMGVRMSEADVLKGVNGSPLIPGWAGFLMIVGLLAGAWYRESESNLLQKGFWNKKTPQPKDGPSV